MTKIEKLTKKQIELQKVVRDEWVDIALKDADIDKEEAEAGVKWLYYASNLKEPQVVFVDGPKDFADKFRASVRASVWDSVGDSVWASVRASVWASVWDSVGDSVAWTSLCGDAEFGAYYEYWKKIKAFDPQEKADKYVGFLRSGAFYCMFFEKKAFVMRRPTIVSQNERKQLHSIKGPALAFKDGTEVYKLNGVTFDKEWWTKIVNDELDPETIFAIDNLEHRRIAYEFMDKSKMKSLKDFTVLDEKVDSKGNPMKIISFKVKNVPEPLKYYDCFCPSTGREYFLGTDKDTCDEAKAASFGLSDVEFVNEW